MRLNAGKAVAVILMAPLIAVACVVLLAAPPAHGANARSRAGLDPTFGGGGVATPAVGGTRYPDVFTDGFVTADGKLVVSESGFISRYLPDGSLDPTFGASGLAGQDRTLGGGPIAELPDGSFVTVRTVTNSESGDMTVLGHFTADGSPLPRSEASARLASFEIRDISGTPNGGVVAAGALKGRPCGGDDSQPALAGLRPDGSLDPGFGSDGITAIGQCTENGALRSVASSPDGRVVASGSGEVVRVQANGLPDPSFGSGGIVNLPISDPRSALAPDGLVIAYGTRNPAGSPDPTGAVAMRLLADGSLDTSYGFSGVAPMGVFNGYASGGAAVDPQGRLVAWMSPANQPYVIRLKADGARDPNFGDDLLHWFHPGGTVPGGDFGGQAIVVGPSGRYYALGSSGLSFAGGTSGFAAALGPAGTLDPGFGASGSVVAPRYGPSSSNLRALVVGPGGSLGFSGLTNTGQSSYSHRRLYVSHLDAGGQTEFGTGVGAFGWAEAGTTPAGDSVLVNPDGTTLASGGPEGAGVLDLFDASGAAESSFGANGSVALRTIGLDRVGMLGRDPSGRFLVAGAGPGVGPKIVRILGDGKVDRDFGFAGVAAVSGRGVRPGDTARSFVTDGRGRILVMVRSEARPGFTLVRLRPGGALDRTFRPRHIGLRGAYPVGMQRLGKSLLVAGAGSGTSRNSIVLAKVTPAGRLDRSFGRRGFVAIRRGSTPVFAVAAGRILVAFTSDLGRRATIRTFTGAGRTATGFGKNGRVVLRVPRGSRTAALAASGPAAFLGISSFDRYSRSSLRIAKVLVR